jgi:hypothetical protein
MFQDLPAATAAVVVLALCVLTILVLAIFNLFQLTRTREMRDDIRELRYYVVQLSRRVNVSLEQVPRPERRPMPIVDRGYWQGDHHDNSFTMPGGRW